MKIATNKCYTSYFSPQRFYEIGLKLEEIEEIDMAKKIINKTSALIREKLLPMKYMCYMVVVTMILITRLYSGSFRIKEYSQ